MRCTCCRVTHALMPSFSLPGTSLGCEEVEDYLADRARGVSRRKAAVALVQQGVGEQGAKRVERMFSVAVAQGKALLPGFGVPGPGFGRQEAGGLEWVASVCGVSDRPLYQIICFGLEHRVNGLCFCRRWLLHYCRPRVGGQRSHNLDSAAQRPPDVESG